MSGVNNDILRILTNIQKSLEKMIDNAERSRDGLIDEIGTVGSRSDEVRTVFPLRGTRSLSDGSRSDEVRTVSGRSDRIGTIAEIDKEFIPDYYILNSSIRSIFNDLSSVDTGNEEIGRKILILLDSIDNNLDYLCDPETMIPGLLDNIRFVLYYIPLYKNHYDTEIFRSRLEEIRRYILKFPDGEDILYSLGDSVE